MLIIHCDKVMKGLNTKQIKKAPGVIRELAIVTSSNYLSKDDQNLKANFKPT